MDKDMKKAMTVVVINDFDYVQGGASKVAIETAQLLYQKGIDVIFFSAVHKKNHYPFKTVSTHQKEMVNDSNRIVAALNNLYNLKAKRELKKLLKKLNPETTILHVHGWTKALSSSVLDIAFRMNFKVVLTAHDYFTICPNGGFFNFQDNVICPYQAMSHECKKSHCDSRNQIFKKYRLLRQWIQNKYVHFPKKLNYLITISDFSEQILCHYFHPKHIYRVYNPTSIKEKKERAKIMNNDYYIFVGRVAKEKGIEQLLNVFSQVDQKLVVVGDGPLLEEAKLKYEKYDYIQFTGWKSQEDVYKMMYKAKGLIFPSLWFEGAPLTIFEAMSMGLPCIVSNKCSAIDFVEHQHTGIIFDPENDKNLKEILSMDKKQLDQLGYNAYQQYWSEPYTKERYVMRIVDVYQQILKEK